MNTGCLTTRNGYFYAVIKYKDIYKDLEDALDKCTSVADIVLNIAAKNN